MLRCCNGSFEGRFRYKFLKPYYRYLEYGVCPVCGCKRFIDYKQIFEDDDNVVEKLKEFKGKAAKEEYERWQNILNKGNQGTLSKQFFYYGEYQRSKNGYFKTYRKNFNNEKEFLFKAKVKIGNFHN